MKVKKLIEKCRFPNNNLFIIGLLCLVFFLLLELLIRSYNLYQHAPLVDLPSHFFAGIALGGIFYWVLSLTELKKTKSFAIVFSLIAAVIWEMMETLEELVFYNPPYLKDIFVWDGFADIIVTVIGALFLMMLFKYSKL